MVYLLCILLALQVDSILNCSFTLSKYCAKLHCIYLDIQYWKV